MGYGDHSMSPPGSGAATPPHIRAYDVYAAGPPSPQPPATPIREASPPLTERTSPITERTARTAILASCHAPNGSTRDEVLVADTSYRPSSQALFHSEPEAALREAFEAPPEFRDPSADILLTSSDNVFFRVHKAILTTGSSYFKRLLLDADRYDSKATPISWAEPASTVSALLYRLYPLPKPDIDDIGHLLLLVIAANKYRMAGVLADLQALLLKPCFLDVRPLAVYSLACRIGLDTIKSHAARRLVELHNPLDLALRPDATDLSALEFIALCDLRQKRVAYCLQLCDGHFPTTCEHMQALSYGRWHDVLRQKLEDNPSASIVTSVLDVSEALEGRTSNCWQDCTPFSWSHLALLKEELADAARFLGDDPNL